MSIKNIPVLTVNYNTPDLCYNLVKSFRHFYNNDFVIIDGSDKELFQELNTKLDEFDNITIVHFGHNIHHGPGLAYGFQNIKSDKILVLDSDVEIINKGFFEDLYQNLPGYAYGIGDCQRIITVETDKCDLAHEGFNVGSRKGAMGLKESEYTEGGIRYLHPAIMLVNTGIILSYAMPIKHGAPMISTMKDIHWKQKSNILIHSEWVHNDFRNEDKIYCRHDWCGTVNRTGGYNLT